MDFLKQVYSPSFQPELDLGLGGVPAVVVPGLSLVEGFVSEDDACTLLSRIDAEPWNTELKRRVQHYGWRYDYRVRRVSAKMYLGPLPEWLSTLSARMVEAGISSRAANQVIVNEYVPPQGISDHSDCEPCFDNTIVSLSLGSPCVMIMKRLSGSPKRIDILLQPRSLLILEGEARYNWTHGIPTRKTDLIGGLTIRRDRRVSLTFRKTLL